MKALIVDDDLALSDVVSFTMRRAGFDVITAHDGRSAMDKWEADDPDIIILDLNLPKLDGLSVCKNIRDQADTPIIILSVRGEEEDVVNGLELGADDYIVKPFSPRQLIARAEAVLRRAKTAPLSPGPLSAGIFILEPARSEVRIGTGDSIQLTQLECRLLEVLMLNCGQVLSSASIIDSVWGSAGADRVMLKQLVYRLRKKIENSPSEPMYLITISGVGYSFEA